jgi:hypothetical protein
MFAMCRNLKRKVKAVGQIMGADNIGILLEGAHAIFGS